MRATLTSALARHVHRGLGMKWLLGLGAGRKALLSRGCAQRTNFTPVYLRFMAVPRTPDTVHTGQHVCTPWPRCTARHQHAPPRRLQLAPLRRPGGEPPPARQRPPDAAQRTHPLAQRRPRRARRRRRHPSHPLQQGRHLHERLPPPRPPRPPALPRRLAPARRQPRPPHRPPHQARRQDARVLLHGDQPHLPPLALRARLAREII